MTVIQANGIGGIYQGYGFIQTIEVFVETGMRKLISITDMNGN